MPTPRYDTLIIGQGLAGSALAWHLIERGERVLVIDDNHHSSSSMVAAGLINPLAGMRFNRRPEAHDWLDAAEAWYARLAGRFGQTYHHALPMVRLFRSTGQQRFYTRRSEDAESDDLLGERFDADRCPEAVAAPNGGFLQRRTAYVDLPLLLSTLRDWLCERRAWREQAIDHAAIRPADDGIRIDDLTARRLVFCDGARLRDNPWFDWLPLTPDKGEIIDLVDGHWRPTHIVNGAHWLVPTHDGRIRCGATHEHHQLDQTTTAGGRDALLLGYRALRPGHEPPEVTAHQAGIRPATKDRYPFLGGHPQHPGLWVFNGFGARGALSIPWYADRFARHLLRGEPLPAEADIRRL